MASPHYGLLQSFNQMQLPKQNNPILQELINYQMAGQQAREANEQVNLQQAQQNLASAQTDTARKKLEYLPQEMDLERQKVLASIAASNASTAATRQGMQTETLRQQQLQLDMKARHAATIYELAAGVKNADPTKKQQALDFARNQAKMMGIPIDSIPQKWSPEAEQFVDNAYIASGRQLKELQAQREASNVKLESVVDPATNKTILVPANQAIGMQPASSSQANIMQKTQIAAIPTYMKDLTEKAQAGTELINNVNAFEGAANEIPTGTGVVSGYASPLSSYGRKAIANQGDLTASLLKTYGSNPTEGERKAAQERVPTVHDSQEARLLKVKEMRARGQDNQEHLKFAQYMLNNGVQDPNSIESAWTTYRQANPIIDPNTGKVNEKNIANWPDYFSKSKSDNANNANITSDGISPGTIVPGKDGKRYQKVEGGYIPIE